MNRRTFLKLSIIPISTILPAIEPIKPKSFPEIHPLANETFLASPQDCFLHIKSNGERIPIKVTIINKSNNHE